MDDTDVYRVLDRRPSSRCRWLAEHGHIRLARLLWRLENPQGRWQAEWDGCQQAPRALTYRSVLRKARQQRT